MATRREVKQAVGTLSGGGNVIGRRAGGNAKILDEFSRVTSYHRKHALRVLHRPFAPRPTRPRKRIYDEAVRQGWRCYGRRSISFAASGLRYCCRC
jgi:hypothetical protein